MKTISGSVFLFLFLLLSTSCPRSLAGTESLPVTVASTSYTDIRETLRIGPEPERMINMTERGHTLLTPRSGGEVVGTVVFFQRGRIDYQEAEVAADSFDGEALARGLGILHVSTGDPLEFFFQSDTLEWAAAEVQSVLAAHGLEDKPVFSAGLSLGGTRSARFAQYLESNPGYGLRVSGLALVDAPLDFERMWYALRDATRRNVHPAAADEGRWVRYLLEQNLGGTPTEVPVAYRRYSPYTKTAENGGAAIALRGIPLRAYHEPDVDWWIENRGKSYYAMNSLDLAGLVNELRLQGNDDAELITTWQSRDGFADGSSPHTWSIVDDAELAAWFRELAVD